MASARLGTNVRFDPYDHSFQDDPYPWYKALRENDPVYRDPEGRFWLLTKYEDVVSVLRDHRSWTSAQGINLDAIANTQDDGYPIVLHSDPPDHSRLRKVFSHLMTPQALAAHEVEIRKRTIALLEPFVDKGAIDFVADFSCYMPMQVLAHLTELPQSDSDNVRQWTDTLLDRDDGQIGMNDSNIESYINLLAYFESFASTRLANGDYGNTILGAILHAENKGTISHKEAVGHLFLLGVAGGETTTKLIGNMVYRLWQHPEQRQMLVDDPSLIPNAVEETLRFDSSSQIIGRTATRDVEIRGKTIRAGERVGCCIISANRDEDKFENGETYNILRNTRGHAAFGYSIHACLGANLARLEARIALEEIVKRMPNYELHMDKSARSHNPNVMGFTHLPATF